MNCVNLIGRLVAKPELRYTSSNIAYTRFTIAVDRLFSNDSQKEVDFINVVVWRKSAENICEYLDKGVQIAIEGRIQTSNYTDQNGNNRTSFEVMAQNVQFLGSKQSSKETQNANSEEQDPYTEFGNTVEITDDFLE